MQKQKNKTVSALLKKQGLVKQDDSGTPVIVRYVLMNEEFFS